MTFTEMIKIKNKYFQQIKNDLGCNEFETSNLTSDTWKLCRKGEYEIYITFGLYDDDIMLMVKTSNNYDEAFIITKAMIQSLKSYVEE